MAGGLPPPPTRAANGDFAWTAWYNQLYTLLSTTGAVSWSLVDKAGSSIADLQNKNHNLLTAMQGGTTNEYYHLTSAEYTNKVSQITKTKAGLPTTADISSGNWAVYKDTSGGSIKLYANDGGTIKSVALV